MSIFSFMGTLRNYCVAVRHILQSFTAIADPWNWLHADITVQNWYKVSSAWPTRSIHL